MLRARAMRHLRDARHMLTRAAPCSAAAPCCRFIFTPLSRHERDTAVFVFFTTLADDAICLMLPLMPLSPLPLPLRHAAALIFAYAFAISDASWPCRC